MKPKHKLIRITTVPISLRTLLKGQMKYMASRGFDVTAITSTDDAIADIESYEGVPVYTVDMTREITPLKDLKAVWQLYQYFRKERPTIVHTHTPKAGIVGMMASWLAGVPIRLHTVAGLPLLVATGKKRKLLNWVEKLTYRFATKVYPNSSVLRDIILQEGFTRAEKLMVIGNGSSNGIDTAHFNPANISKDILDNLKEKYQIATGDFVFIFVGRIVGDKGINELLLAFDHLSKKYKQAKLMLVGDFEEVLDPITAASKRIIQENKNIMLTGFQKDVRPFLAISQALVFPSYREGFPNVVMQAGAMGLPAIVSDINGCNEIIIPAVNGYIVPVKDAKLLEEQMIHLLEDPAHYHTLQQAAREQITSRYEQRVVWEALYAEYEWLMRKLQ